MPQRVSVRKWERIDFHAMPSLSASLMVSSIASSLMAPGRAIYLATSTLAILFLVTSPMHALVSSSQRIIIAVKLAFHPKLICVLRQPSRTKCDGSESIKLPVQLFGLPRFAFGLFSETVSIMLQI